MHPERDVLAVYAVSVFSAALVALVHLRVHRLRFIAHASAP